MELTPLLLEQRMTHLHRQCEAIAGPIEATLFQRIGCDRCGFVFDFFDLGVYPTGWTTTGDFERGWTDLCRGCSG